MGCLVGASWREKLFVCKLPGASLGSPRGSWRASLEAFGSSFSSLLSKTRFLEKSRFPHGKTMIFEGPEPLRGDIFRLEIGPKTLCVALGARFRARSITRRVQDRSGEPPGAKKKGWTRPGAPQDNFPAILRAAQNRHPPPQGGASGGSAPKEKQLFMKIFVFACAGRIFERSGVWGAILRGWGEKLKLLQTTSKLVVESFASRSLKLHCVERCVISQRRGQ